MRALSPVVMFYLRLADLRPGKLVTSYLGFEDVKFSFVNGQRGPYEYHHIQTRYRWLLQILYYRVYVRSTPEEEGKDPRKPVGDDADPFAENGNFYVQ